VGKFFFKPSERDGDQICITGSMAHHMIHVLRLRIGQELRLCDGKNLDFVSQLTSISVKPDVVTFNIISQSPSGTEAIAPVTLYQGLPKGDKMDWIIEKSVEAGVVSIVPVCTSRTVVKVKDAEKKADRFMRISESAASQSMRGIIPTVSPPLSFASALSGYDANSLCLIAYEKECSRTIKHVLNNQPPVPVSLWIGPEGGFEESEIEALVKKGAIPISLGPRILRTETAALIALSQILYTWE